MWYAAHIVMALHRTNGPQDRFPIWENIVLLKASSIAEARRKAEEVGLADTGDDTVTWDEHPAEWRFAGVRKILKCESDDIPPADGTEISFSEYVLEDEASIKAFVEGKRTTLICDE